MSKVYLDHSATTPVDKKVLEKMLPYFGDKYGNPSSIHYFGQTAISAVDDARAQVASFLNTEPDEIIFTSGATESNNLALKGFVKALRQKNKKKSIHIITSMIEHDAILEPCMELEKEGVEVTFLPVKPNGVVEKAALEKAIKENTRLISIMYVNSEVGAVQPIREIGKTIKKINEKRLNEWKKKRPKDRGDKPEQIYFHTDATQAVNFYNCDTRWNYIDILSMSGHKIYGPKGVGVFFRKSGIPMVALQRGGHHEGNLRSGTLNVTGIVGLGAAVGQITKEKQERDNKKIKKLRDMLVDGIMATIPDTILNTDRDIATPAHAHFSFLGAEGEAILLSLDLKGIAVSTGSACAAGSLKASHVLISMGIKKEIAHNSIRFSLGKHNTEEDIKKILKELPPILKHLRNMNPLYKK